MPGTTSKAVTIARGVEVSGDPAMANALRRWLVATRGPKKVAREILRQQRAVRKAQIINRHNLNLARRDRRVNQ